MSNTNSPLADRFWMGGSESLRRADEQERRRQLESIARRLRREMDPEIRNQLLKRYARIWASRDFRDYDYLLF